VTNTNPGNNPTVWFQASDNKGNPLNAAKLTSLSFILAGPTTDYTFPAGSPSTENALPYVTATSGGFFYTMAAAIPKNAAGTSYAIGAQASQTVTITASLLDTTSLTVTQYAPNPVFYFGVGGAAAVPRRQVVSTANCNVCHDTLRLHGGSRNNATAYCQMCHNPSADDSGFRPTAQLPVQTINLKTHIHRIHSGVNLQNDWTIWGFGGSPFNFNGTLYPGDRRDCAKCHVNNAAGVPSYELPLPAGLASEPTPRLFYTPTGPIASACLGCHDDQDTASHAYLQTASFGESCPVCHEEGADFAVSVVHGR